MHQTLQFNQEQLLNLKKDEKKDHLLQKVELLLKIQQTPKTPKTNEKDDSLSQKIDLLLKNDALTKQLKNSEKSIMAITELKKSLNHVKKSIKNLTNNHLEITITKKIKDLHLGIEQNQNLLENLKNKIDKTNNKPESYNFKNLLNNSNTKEVFQKNCQVGPTILAVKLVSLTNYFH